MWQVASRLYYGFEWGGCWTFNMLDPNRTADSHSLRTFHVATGQASCNDTFEFGYLVAGLVSECGLARDYRQYDGTRDDIPSLKYGHGSWHCHGPCAKLCAGQSVQHEARCDAAGCGTAGI
jgi:hypothetical protein